jgi:3-hydroxyacyl-CoA dehydrogenase
MFVERVGVVGAGTMGADIAGLFVVHGIPVTLADVREDQLSSARRRIRDALEIRQQRGRLSPAAVEDRMSHLDTVTKLDRLGAVDLAIEAVPERMDVKRSVLNRLDHVLDPIALVATNTSALSVTTLATATNRPSRVAGLHFFYPAHRMPLVEVVRGERTSAETMASLIRVAEEIRKLPIAVNDSPGFVVNRVLMRALGEVFRFQEETGASDAAIDRAIQAAGAAPMGPLALADALGLDVVAEVSATLEKALGTRFRVGDRVWDLVRAGRLGAKVPAGGFYDPGRPPVDDVLAPLEAERLVRRFQLAAANEAGRLVDDGVAVARDIDLAIRAGAGLKQGPLAWADEEGLDAVLDEMRAAGAGFEPPASLIRLVDTGWVGRAAGAGYHVHRDEGRGVL